MITYKKGSFEQWRVYDQIPMTFTATHVLKVCKQGKGLGGISYSFEKMPVTPYFVDMDGTQSAKRWTQEFDVRNWVMFMAYDEEKPVGGAVVAAKTPEIRMLDGRDDMAVLWDIRVKESYKSRGIGGELFQTAVNWCKDKGYALLKIECQNTNPAACRFYEKQGAELEVVNRYGYGDGECMFLWYLHL